MCSALASSTQSGKYVPDIFSVSVRLWLPASLYRLCPYKRPDSALENVCQTFTRSPLPARLYRLLPCNRTSSFPGVVPIPSMESTRICSIFVLIRSRSLISGVRPRCPLIHCSPHSASIGIGVQNGSEFARKGTGIKGTEVIP